MCSTSSSLNARNHVLAFQGQEGWSKLLQRFHSGGGELLDVEFIVNDQGQYNVFLKNFSQNYDVLNSQKLAVFERLIWQLRGHTLVAIAVVERFKQEPIFGLSAGTNIRGRCRQVAVSGGLTVLHVYKLYLKQNRSISQSYQSIDFLINFGSY